MRLTVVTPRGVVLDRDVDEIRAPGLLGEFGVLPGHVPVVSAVRDGTLLWRHKGEEGRIHTGEGFVEVDRTGNVSAVVSAVTAENSL